MIRLILYTTSKGLLIFLGMSAVTCFAEAWYCRPDAHAQLCIRGNITSQDATFVKSFAKNFSKLKSDNPSVRALIWLDSPGGDIMAAMNIGRILRGLRSIATVPESSGCSSACVFLLAGATTRVPFGKIGIHRPYFTETRDLSYVEAQTRYRALQFVVKTYLEEMNMPGRLYEEMNVVPPDQIRILTFDEISQLGLGADDPAENDIRDAQDARKYRITKQELFSRRIKSSIVCSDSFEDFQANPDLKRAEIYTACQESVLRSVR